MLRLLQYIALDISCAPFKTESSITIESIPSQKPPNLSAELIVPVNTPRTPVMLLVKELDANCSFHPAISHFELIRHSLVLRTIQVEIGVLHV